MLFFEGIELSALVKLECVVEHSHGEVNLAQKDVRIEMDAEFLGFVADRFTQKVLRFCQAQLVSGEVRVFWRIFFEKILEFALADEKAPERLELLVAPIA